MVDDAQQSLTTAAVADLTGGQLVGPGDIAITGMQTLADAMPGDLSFVTDAKFFDDWNEAKAAAALVPRDLEIEPGDGRALIRVDHVDLAVGAVLGALAPDWPQPDAGVHASANVDPGANVATSAHIGAGCYIGPGAHIGEGAVLHPNVTVMNDSSIGDGSILWPGVVIRERCILGRGCILHPNVTVGSDGFGYRPAADGGGLVKIPQIGTVEIGDDVEIGAGTCIDRGKFGATTIGDQTKIDNLVHIAHNCRVGRCVVLTGQVGLAGSVVAGDGVMIGGNTAIRDHVTLGAGAKVGGHSGVMVDVAPGKTVAGAPAKDAKIMFREIASVAKLPDLIKRVKKLERNAKQES